MSHRHSRWFREAQEQRPLQRVTCHTCDEVMLSTDPELTKVAHQAARHFGRPWSFSVRPHEEAADANG